MKKLTTLAAASALTLAASQAMAIPGTITVNADVLAVPGATQAGSGTGDYDAGTGVFTFDLTTTVDLTYGTAVIEANGTATNTGAGIAINQTATSCSGPLAATVCPSVPLGTPGDSVSIENVNIAAGATTAWTVATSGPNTSDASWSVTVEAGMPPPPPPPPAVPVPAAAWLFGSALLGLAGVRRK